MKNGFYWYRGPRAGKGMDAIVKSGIFFLQIGYPPLERSLRRPFDELVAASAGRGIRVSVVVGNDPAAAAELGVYGVSEMSLDVSAWVKDETGMRRAIDQLRRAAASSGNAPKVGALLRPEKKNLASLPAFIKASREAEVDFVEIPPIPLVYYSPGEAAGAVLGVDEYRFIKTALTGCRDAIDRIKDARIHDILVWAIWSRLSGITQGEDGGFRGCQGATALAHIDPAGTVYPCASIPIPMGRIEDIGEARFWNRRQVREIRDVISRIRSSCRECSVLDLCRGGCPGMRLAASGSWEGEDPVCGAFRELSG